MLDENIEKLSSDDVNDASGKENVKREDNVESQEIKSVEIEKSEENNVDKDKVDLDPLNQKKDLNEKEEINDTDESVGELEISEDTTLENESKKSETETETGVEIKPSVKEGKKDLSEVDSTIEEESDESSETVKKEVPKIDFSNFSVEELVFSMEELIQKYAIQEIKNQFEALKSDFTKKINNIISKKKEDFLKEGGNEIDFSFHLPVKNKFNDLFREYKRKRQKHYKDIELEQKLNLDTKLALIDDLKHLIENAEPSTMYKKFRVLQDEWRKVGQIPHSKYNDIWRTYHHHVERFYDLLHLSNDFRDLDFKHNLELKNRLIDKVEKLVEEADINHAFKELQILHRMWKEEIGPVARDIREEVWNRFSEATKKIHDRRHEYQNKLEVKFKENMVLKLAVIEKIKSVEVEDTLSHKIFQEKIKNIEELRNEFFSIGRVPRVKNEEIWQLFKDATRKFNKAKNSFYKNIKKEQTDNLTKKRQLVEQAESLQDSDDWELVTEVYKKIQSDWKNVGHVPRRDSDKIWKRFKDACNHYFERLHEKQDGSNKEQAEVFNKKKDLLSQFKDDINQEDKLSLDLVNQYIQDWKKLGVVPVKMRHIEGKFNKAIDLACKQLNLGKDESELLKFKNIIDTYLEQNDVRKIDNEQLFIRRRMDELTKEIKLLENNISFISNATKDNPLVKNVYKNMDNYKEQYQVWKKKLDYLRHLDY